MSVCASGLAQKLAASAGASKVSSELHKGKACHALRQTEHFQGTERSAFLAAGCASGSARSRNLQVLAGKGRQQNRSVPGKNRNPMENINIPEGDPNNPQFAIYVRSKAVNQWYPVSVVSGGSAAKALITVTENEFGKKIYGDALTKNIGNVIYKDEAQIKGLALRSFPILKSAKALQWGYKLMDPENMRKSMMPVNVQLIPPEEELKGLADKAAQGVQGIADKLGGMFGGKK